MVVGHPKFESDFLFGKAKGLGRVFGAEVDLVRSKHFVRHDGGGGVFE